MEPSECQPFIVQSLSARAECVCVCVRVRVCVCTLKASGACYLQVCLSKLSWKIESYLVGKRGAGIHEMY